MLLHPSLTGWRLSCRRAGLPGSVGGQQCCRPRRCCQVLLQTCMQVGVSSRSVAAGYCLHASWSGTQARQRPALAVQPLSCGSARFPSGLELCFAVPCRSAGRATTCSTC